MIVLPNVSPAVRKTASEALQRLVDHSWNAYAWVAQESTGITAPMEVVTVTCKEMVPGSFLETTSQNADRVYRFFLQNKIQNYAVDVGVPATGGAPYYLGMTWGAEVDRCLHAAIIGEKHMRDGTYEARILEIPSLFAAALWLDDSINDSNDCFIPFMSGEFLKLQDFDIVAEAAFINRARDAAIEAINSVGNED